MKKILIDLTSIRKNPDYAPPGSKKYIGGKWTMHYLYKGDSLPIMFKEDENCSITHRTYSFNGGGEDIITGYSTDHTLMEEVLKLPKEERDRLEIKFEREIIDLTTKDDPLYLYEYIHIDVTCKYCKHIFKSNELESDYQYTGIEELYSDEICPNCEGWDCLKEEIEFESIDEALERQKIESYT